MTVPKDTFLNLPEKKRTRIVSAMVDEFALNGYRKASLNSLIKASGISKGSLYQYFSSKEEIFLYIFDQFTSLVKRSIIKNHNSNGVTLWGGVKYIITSGIDFIDKHPAYFQLYLRVLFEHDVPRREELISEVRHFSNEFFLPLIDEAFSNNLLRPDLSTDMIVFCLDAMIDRFLQGYARPYLDGGLGLSRKTILELDAAVDDIINFLRNGFENKNIVNIN